MAGDPKKAFFRKAKGTFNEELARRIAKQEGLARLERETAEETARIERETVRFKADEEIRVANAKAEAATRAAEEAARRRREVEETAGSRRPRQTINQKLTDLQPDLNNYMEPSDYHLKLMALADQLREKGILVDRRTFTNDIKKAKDGRDILTIEHRIRNGKQVTEEEFSRYETRMMDSQSDHRARRVAADRGDFKDLPRHDNQSPIQPVQPNIAARGIAAIAGAISTLSTQFFRSSGLITPTLRITGMTPLTSTFLATAIAAPLYDAAFNEPGRMNIITSSEHAVVNFLEGAQELAGKQNAPESFITDFVVNMGTTLRPASGDKALSNYKPSFADQAKANALDSAFGMPPGMRDSIGSILETEKIITERSGAAIAAPAAANAKIDAANREAVAQKQRAEMYERRMHAYDRPSPKP